MQYPIYYPTIDGKTKVLKAPKGTQNWVEISPDEARDTATYDYKLENTTSDLGSTPSVNDYIDRARKVKVVNTKESTLNGLESDWTKSLLTTTEYFTAYIKINDIYRTSVISAVSDKFVVSTSSLIGNCIFKDSSSNDYLFIRILSSKLATQDVTGLKAYLQANPVTIRYQLATPQEIPLTDEELKAYDAYKKVILLPFAEDKVALNEDGSGTWNRVSETFKPTTENIATATYASATDSNYTTYHTAGAFGYIEGVCNKLKLKTSIIALEKGFYIKNGYLYITLPNTELPTQDRSGFLQYLSDCIFIVSKTPTVTTLDKSIMPVIQTSDKINILNVESPVAPSSLTLTLPTSDDISKAYNNIVLLNGYTQTVGTAAPIVNLSNTGIVRLQMDLTTPATSINTTLFTLPTELRPVTSARIPVFVNGVCQLATIDKTTGNVNLTSTPSASANIYIKTDYRRDI